MQTAPNRNFVFLLRLACLYLILFTTNSAVFAEQLPIKTYSSADGLASSVIHSISRDSRGFLWFCARGGLSRFDGYEFISYKLPIDQSLGLVHNFRETSDGTYWISTDSGLYRVKPEEKTDIQPLKTEFYSGERLLNAKKVSNKVFFTLFEDKKNNLWGGSDGLYLITNKEADEVNFEEKNFNPEGKKKNQTVNDFAEAADGSVWGAFSLGLLRIVPDGRIFSYELPYNESSREAYNLMLDSSGKIWLSHSRGLFLFQPDAVESLANQRDGSIFPLNFDEQEIEFSGSVNFPASPRQLFRFNVSEGKNDTATKTELQDNREIQKVYQMNDGKVLLPFKESLYIFDSENYTRLTDSNSLSGQVRSIVEDLSGNIWFGSFSGVGKFSRNGLISYNQNSGLIEPTIHSIQESLDNELLVFHGQWRVSRLSNRGIESAQLNLPRASRFSWTSRPIFEDKNGNLWSLTIGGLYKFPYQKSLTAQAKQTPQLISIPDVLSKTSSLYRAFSDNNNNLWFSIRGPNQNRLFRFDGGKNEWTDFSEKAGYPKGFSVVSMAEDNAGNYWFSVYGRGGLFKFANDKFTEFTTADGLPDGSIFALHIDQKGRLWIGSTTEGLAKVENPTAEKLSFIRYAEKEGLTNNNVRCLTEDNFGNIYAGTVRGVSRINPENGQIKQISTADGLAADFVHAAFRDKNGVIWFGTANGLSKFTPTAEKEPITPTIYLNNLQIAGETYGISEFGQQIVEIIEVAASQNNLRIDFFGIGEGADLRYQYKFDGTDQDWSTPSDQRSVNFANLSSGSYRFLVRAVNNSGVSSPKPAIVSFTIRPPFYRSWWFLTLAFLFVAGAVFALDRYRVRKTQQVEKALDETKRANVLIRESEIRFRTLADTASDAILTIDADSNIIFVNEAIEKVFGYSPQELIGKPMTMLMPERMRSSHDAGLNRYLQTNQKNINWEGVSLPGLHKDGHEIPLEVSFGEFEREGKRYFTGIARDVSERKRAEEALQRAREEKFKELQRVRTRIATDLHDDIGSSLTQISLYSELARQKEQENGKAGEQLNVITNVANELVETMSDIVWAINPKKDHLQDLTQRMRRFAANILTAKDIDMEFLAPDSDQEIPLGANIRREVFLIFKETVNNIAKHSEATEAQIRFSMQNDFLIISFNDNGKGFDKTEKLNGNSHTDWKKFRGGNGLNNMRKRAQDLGGEYEITSEIGKGTIVILSVPLLQEESIHKTFA